VALRVLDLGLPEGTAFGPKPCMRSFKSNATGPGHGGTWHIADCKTKKDSTSQKLCRKRSKWPAVQPPCVKAADPVRRIRRASGTALGGKLGALGEGVSGR